MGEAVNILVGVLVLFGAFMMLVAAIGVLRLDDLYTRMHAASKAGTVGVGTLMIAVAIYSGETAVALRALAGVVFFLLTTPVSAHLLARAAYLAGYRPSPATGHDALSGEVPAQRRAKGS